ALFLIAWLWAALATSGWENKWLFLVVMGVVGAAVVALFLSWRRLAPRFPGRWIRTSDPGAREYWNTPTNRIEFNRRISEDLERSGAVSMVFLAGLVLLFGSAAGARIETWVLATGIAVFVAVVLVYCLFLAFGNRYRS